MKFNTANGDQAKAAMSYLERLIFKERLVEVKKLSGNRSNSQNRYLHLLLGAFGSHFGWTLDESKEIYKRDVNKDIFEYKKQGRTFWRSSAALSVDEMTVSIDRFRQFSDEQGYPLPLATDKNWLMEIENEIERTKYYLK